MRNRTYQFGFINDSVFRNATLRNVKNILCKKYHLLNKYKKFIFFFDGVAMEDDNKKLISYGITKDSLIIVKGEKPLLLSYSINMEKYLSLLNQYHSKSKSNTSYTNNNDYFIPISNQEKPKLDNLPSHREERVSDIKILLNKCNINRDKHDHHSIESVKYKNSLQIKTENAVNINNNSNSNGKIFSKTSDMNQDTRSQSTLYVNTSDSEHLILEETKSKKTDSEETIVDNSITDETIFDRSNSEKQIYNEIKMQKEKLSPPIEEDQLAFLERRFEAIIEDIIPLIIIFREKVENYPNNVSLKDLNDSYQLIKCLLMKQLNLINNIKINDSKVQEEHKFTMTLIQELLFKIDVQKNEFF